MTDDTQARLDRLEAQLQRATDELDIIKLLARYGPAADSADQPAYSRLWADGGGLNSPVHGLIPQERVMSDELHLKLCEDGAAHVPSIPFIRIDGDTAVAYHYHRVYVPGPETKYFSTKGAVVARLAYIRNDLVRTPAGWRLQRRTSIALAGDQTKDAQQLMVEASEAGARD
ncbi:nuclear transport factor 2 family protein [Nocardia sp. CA-120079]|uniref:nuclear transport factor 2 family protein n=1 Tax=Nocardia sp. CA-120079 TaxID=3239974 RepID=UPI003D99D75D